MMCAECMIKMELITRQIDQSVNNVLEKSHIYRFPHCDLDIVVGDDRYEVVKSPINPTPIKVRS